MFPFGILIAVAVFIAAIAVLGFRPRGGRPVARSGLMTSARVVLVVLALIVVWLWLRR